VVTIDASTVVVQCVEPTVVAEEESATDSAEPEVIGGRSEAEDGDGDS
jgi:hypothetical protein